MNRRTQESPMDFAWANGTGPVESSSPFLNLAKSRQQNQHNDSAAKKRTHSAFNSPHKSQTPSLREPASQSFFFSMPTTNDKPLPAVPDQFRTPAFTTPRKIDTDFCSSGGETPITPDNNADSEATPDNMGVRSKASSMFGRSGASSSPNKTTRESLWGRIVGSPGRGEISRGHYSNKAEKKIRKRRARTETRAVRRADDASDSEEGSSESRRNSDDRKDVRSKADAPPQQSTSSITTFFSFLETHPNLPHILSFYAQLLLNVFIVFFIIYIIYSFWSTIRSDVDKKSQEAAAEILAEMAICAQNYRENRCERETRVPAMESVCVNWEKCMSRDPRSVGRARVSAHTFAEIFNSFIEPISYKAMIFSIVIVFGCIAISNFAFSFFRNRDAVHQHISHSYMHHPPPPTPQRLVSGGMMHEHGFYTPYGNRAQIAGLEPAPSGGLEGVGSPVKQLTLH